VNIAILTDIIDIDDIRVMQIGGRLGFVVEAPQKGVVASVVAMQYFHGNTPVQALVTRQIHARHTAFPDLALKLIARI
jgi:hypothetical protein